MLDSEITTYISKYFLVSVPLMAFKGLETHQPERLHTNSGGLQQKHC